MKKILFFCIFIFFCINICLAVDKNLYNTILDSIETTENVNEQLLNDLVQQNQSNKVFLFSLVNKLRVYYTEKYFINHSKPITVLEDFFSKFFGLQSRLGYFYFLVDREILNPYTTNEFIFFSRQSHNEQLDDILRTKAIKLYIALTELRKSKCDYQLVCSSLLNCLDYKTKDNHFDKLQMALEKTNHFELLLSIQLYREFDRNDCDKIDYKQYENTYKKIKNPKYTFAQYIELSKKEVLSDYTNKFTSDLSRFANFSLKNENNQESLISTSDVKSNYYNKKLFIVFFSVTCHNCIAEMDEINRMQDFFKQNDIVPIGIYTLYNKSVNVSEQLLDFKNKHNYFFDLYLDTNGNNVASQYKIPHVPFCLLVDTDNHIFSKGGFNYYGNLREKIENLMLNFIDKKSN